MSGTIRLPIGWLSRSWIERLVWISSSICLAVAGWLWWEANTYSRRGNVEIAALGPSASGALAERPAGFARTGDPIARLEAESLDLSVIVAEGADAAVLRRSVGRLERSAALERGGRATGNVVLAGHRDTHFAPLRNVEPGDQLVLEDSAGRSIYEVVWTRVVDPADVWVTADSGKPELTLITCYPFRWIGPAPERFIVRARLRATSYQTTETIALAESST